MNRDIYAGAGTYALRPTRGVSGACDLVRGGGDGPRRAARYFEQARNAIDQAVDVEIDEAYDTGNLLFSDPRGIPLALYGTKVALTAGNRGTVVGRRNCAPRLEPR